jgi:ornithine cyclodeaminase
VNVSLDDLASGVLTGCDRLFVDDWSLIVADEQRLLGRLARAGLVCGPGESRTGARSVDGTIADLVSSNVAGRESDAEIVVINPFGMAAADVFLADALVRNGLND